MAMNGAMQRYAAAGQTVCPTCNGSGICTQQRAATIWQCGVLQLMQSGDEINLDIHGSQRTRPQALGQMTAGRQRFPGAGQTVCPTCAGKGVCTQEQATMVWNFDAMKLTQPGADVNLDQYGGRYRVPTETQRFLGDMRREYTGLPVQSSGSPRRSSPSKPGSPYRARTPAARAIAPKPQREKRVQRERRPNTCPAPCPGTYTYGGMGGEVICKTFLSITMVDFHRDAQGFPVVSYPDDPYLETRLVRIRHQAMTMFGFPWNEQEEAAGYSYIPQIDATPAKCTKVVRHYALGLAHDGQISRELDEFLFSPDTVGLDNWIGIHSVEFYFIINFITGMSGCITNAGPQCVVLAAELEWVRDRFTRDLEPEENFFDIMKISYRIFTKVLMHVVEDHGQEYGADIHAVAEIFKYIYCFASGHQLIMDADEELFEFVASLLEYGEALVEQRNQ